MALEIADAIEGTYKVAGNGNVNLTVIVGSGQPGVTSAFLDGTLLQSQPNLLNQSLGVGNALLGKELMIVSTVTDVRQETNLTGVYYTLIGGVEPRNVPHEHTVSAHGNSVSFAAIFKFD